MGEATFQYVGRHSLVCSANPLISMWKDTFQYAEGHALVCSGNPLISMGEATFQYAERQSLVCSGNPLISLGEDSVICRKTLISIQEDWEEIGKTLTELIFPSLQLITFQATKQCPKKSHKKSL